MTPALAVLRLGRGKRDRHRAVPSLKADKPAPYDGGDGDGELTLAFLGQEHRFARLLEQVHVVSPFA